MGSVMTDPDVRILRVRASPYFPDAAYAESEVFFNFRVVRQRASHPSAAEALGEREGCWLVSTIEADWQAWEVHDKIGAGRCPDSFNPKDFQA